MRYTQYKVFLFVLFLSATLSLPAQKITPSIEKRVDRAAMTHWVDSVFGTMDLDRRIGQLFTVIVPGENTAANRNAIIRFVEKQHIGGILFSKSTPVAQAELTNAAQAKAQTPLLITLDGEWGLAMRLKNTTDFPRNMMLGAIQNDSLLYDYGLEVARQCRPARITRPPPSPVQVWAEVALK